MGSVTFKSNFDVFLKATKDQLNKAAEIIGGKAESYAKDLCPVDTGNLQSSISHEVEQERHAITVTVGTRADHNTDYAVYVELGTGRYAENGNGRQTPWTYRDREGKFHTTVGMRPQPFIRPALDDHHDEWRSILEQCLSEKGVY